MKKVVEEPNDVKGDSKEMDSQMRYQRRLLHHEKKGTIDSFRQKERLRAALWHASLDGEKLEKRKEDNRNRQRRYRERQLEKLMSKENEVKTRQEIQKLKEEKQAKILKKPSR